MLYISNYSTDPYFNIAAEEYLLKNFSQQIFMLWRSTPSIIVGKNQNALAEINSEFVAQNNIAVIRRLSGGGTVFHDLGNLNFTFIDNKEKGSFIESDKYTFAIVDALQSLGVDAKVGGCNDLRIDELKISGNAEHAFHNRVLHHGTLLFDSQIDHLNAALKVNLEKFKDKAVQSRRSKVTNIKNYLKRDIDILQFRDLIFQHIIANNKNCEEYTFTENDIKEINLLVEEKYTKWEWNFGSLPKYAFNGSFVFSGEKIEFTTLVRKGTIKEFSFATDHPTIKALEAVLIGTTHRKSALQEKLNSIQPISSETTTNLLAALF